MTAYLPQPITVLGSGHTGWTRQMWPSPRVAGTLNPTRRTENLTSSYDRMQYTFRYEKNKMGEGVALTCSFQPGTRVPHGPGANAQSAAGYLFNCQQKTHWHVSDTTITNYLIEKSPRYFFWPIDTKSPVNSHPLNVAVNQPNLFNSRLAPWSSLSTPPNLSSSTLQATSHKTSSQVSPQLSSLHQKVCKVRLRCIFLLCVEETSLNFPV